MKKLEKYLLLLLLLLHLFLLTGCRQVSAETEAEALVNWKSSLASQSLSSWSLNSGSGRTSPCKWIGILCNNDGSVVQINLANSGLRGALNRLNFPSLSNLTSLRLEFNNLEGVIPTQIGTLSKLAHLNLGHNSFTGTLPLEIGNLSNLQGLDLSSNFINGSIPAAIGKLHKLSFLQLSQNKLSGFLVPEIGNLTQLVSLELQHNCLTGTLPPHIGNLTQLTYINLLNNSLDGTLPPEIGDLKSLRILDMSYNQFSGTIPQDFGWKTSLVNVTFSRNRFSGTLPPYICNGFNLVKLTVDSNNFTGPLPKCLRNCTKLVRIRLEENHFTGSISEVFGVHPSLDYIDLTRNQFSGEISPKWGKCVNLTSLRISENLITGVIPPEIGRLSKLQVLILSTNQLTGNIPTELAQLKLLYKLDVSHNQLSGKIPPDIGKLSGLKELDLSTNKLTGSIPEQLGDCSDLLLMNLRNNNLTGSIPSQIGNLVRLQSLLDLSSNSLAGIIPRSLGNLGALEILDLSHNKISGFIPSSLSGMISLVVINFSNNDLSGSIPDSPIFQKSPASAFDGNIDLCGVARGLQPCNPISSNGHRKKHQKLVIGTVVPVLGFLVALLLIVAGIFVVVLKQKETDYDTRTLIEQHGFSVWAIGWKFTSVNIINATENFNDRHCIGQGGFGNVYKAILPTGFVVAVKRIDQSEDAILTNRKSFENEISALTRIRHRNIVKLYGFSSENQCMFLVYEYVENGSLGDLLYSEQGVERLDWARRLKIIEGMAHALSYLHHDCLPPIVHRDISVSNILLDSSLEPRISDFGTAKVLGHTSSPWTTVAGSYGYMAPELAYTTRVNEKCDVYGFGVIALEVIMGKHPGDLISSSSSSRQGIPVKDVLDQRITPPTGRLAEEVIFIVTMGLACVRVNPKSRPSMRCISQELSVHDSTCVFKSFDVDKLQQLAR